MKRNSFGLLFTLFALAISGCTSTPKKKPRRTSSAEYSSESSLKSSGDSLSSNTSAPVSASSASSATSNSDSSASSESSTTSSSSGSSTTSSSSGSSGSSGTSDVPPEPVHVDGVTVSPKSLEKKVGDTGVQLVATVSPSNADNKNVTWESSKSSVASVSNSGVVQFVGEGSATITVETVDGGYTDTCSVTVSKATPPGPDDYYAQCEGLSGSALEAKLKQINSPKSPSYDWGRYEDADEAEDDSTCILSLYTRHNIKKSNHCGSYSWDKWNREHIWTQSAFPASDTDNHNIFACEGQINGYRSNKPFAEGGETVVVFGHVTGCKQTSSTFEPCDEAKGEVARSVMYGTVMYSYTMTQEIDSIYLALKWHIEHPITTRDTKRNDVVYKNQGNRNPFVDHPEYACKIWGGTNSQTKSLCGIS